MAWLVKLVPGTPHLNVRQLLWINFSFFVLELKLLTFLHLLFGHILVRIEVGLFGLQLIALFEESHSINRRSLFFLDWVFDRRVLLIIFDIELNE